MKRYYIKEACEKLGVNTYDLRYLEKALNLKAKRDNLQNRYYTEDDIFTLKSIINLKNQGLNYKAIKTALKIKSTEKNNEQANQVKKDQEQKKELTLYKENNKININLKNIINESLNNNLNPKFKEIESKIDNLSENLKNENSTLKKEIEKNQEKHFKELDKKLITWREKSKAKQQQQKPWYKKIFS